jgi:hypothetical protein
MPWSYNLSSVPCFGSGKNSTAACSELGDLAYVGHEVKVYLFDHFKQESPSINLLYLGLTQRHLRTEQGHSSRYGGESSRAGAQMRKSFTRISISTWRE